jgi:hypothetical protein
LGQRAHVDHVSDQVAEVARNARVAANDLLDGQGIDRDIGARDRLLDIVGVKKAPPGATEARSRANESGFMATTISCSSLRAMKPSLLARIVYQVGKPWMLEGKRFFPETGMPILKMARKMVLLAVELPEPFLVPTMIEKSLITLFMRLLNGLLW